MGALPLHVHATGRTRRSGLALLAVIAVIAALVAPLGAGEAQASHFRSGHGSFSWESVGDRQIEFRVQSSFRRSGYRCVDPQSGGSTPCSGDDNHPMPGDVFAETVGGTTFYFGDGSHTGRLHYVADSVDVDRDWVYAFALDPDALAGGVVSTRLRHTYADDGVQVASIDTCCRLGSGNGHVNNSNGDYRIEAVVDVGAGNRSPVSVMPPIVACEIDGLCQFPVLADDPDGDTLAFRLATPQEATGGSSFRHPGEGQPDVATASIDEQTGVYTWDTRGATTNHPNPTYYSTQVVIEDLDDEGGVRSKVAVDFFIELRASVTDPPQFPGHDPGRTAVLRTHPGDTVTFDVRATAAEPDLEITLNALNLPDGATMDPPLPHTDTGTVTSTFTWSPGGAEEEVAALRAFAAILEDAPGVEQTQLVVFSATDQEGSSANLNYRIEVYDVVDVAVDAGEAALSTGESRQLTARALYSDEVVQDVTTTADWASSDTDVVTVDGDGAATGRSAGQAEVTASFGGQSGSTWLTVEADQRPRVALSALGISPESSTIEVGDAARLTATARYSDGTAVVVADGVEWSTSHADIAAVDDEGRVAAAGPGTAEITATYGHRAAVAEVHVVAPVLELSPASVDVEEDQRVILTARAMHLDGSISDVTGDAGWASADPDIAQVAGGEVVGIAPGETEITATYGGASTSAPVTVTEAVAEDGPQPALQVLAGRDRIETAIAVSRDMFADAAGDRALAQADPGGRATAGAVVLARSTEFADALAGTPLADELRAPVLLTPSGTLDGRVLAEIERVLLPGGTVHLLGGVAALSPSIAAELADAGYAARRLAGPDRVGTALAIAETLDRDRLIITTGTDFPDALAAGAAAVSSGAAVVLSSGERPHPDVDRFLAARPESAVHAVGGPAARAYPGAAAVFGPTREGTALAVAGVFFSAPEHVGFASSGAFPDALAGGVHIARLGGPVLLTPSDRLDVGAEAYLCAMSGGIVGAHVYGGAAAISPSTVDVIADRLLGVGCD